MKNNIDAIKKAERDVREARRLLLWFLDNVEGTRGFYHGMALEKSADLLFGVASSLFDIQSQPEFWLAEAMSHQEDPCATKTP